MTETLITSAQIDFLPVSYREQSTKRKVSYWRLLVIALFGGMFVSTAIYQMRLGQQAEVGLVNVENQYASAVAETNRFAELQAKLGPANTQAELLTYLRHPWPRTQILAAILTPLPDGIELRELRMGRQRVEKPPAKDERTAVSPETANNDKTPPAGRDLARLQSETDGMQLVVTLTGTTTDADALHAFLDKLGRDKLFAQVRLGTIDARSNESAAGENAHVSRFTAQLFVSPGYGQAGGPTPLSDSPSADRGPTALLSSSPREVLP